MLTRRKSRAVLLALTAALLSGLVMSGCGNTQDKSESSDNNTSSSVQDNGKSNDTSAEESQNSADDQGSTDSQNSAESQEESSVPPMDEELVKTITILTNKKNELKEQKNFTYDTTGDINMGRLYYCDAVIKDFDADGNYEMVVKFVTTPALPGSKEYNDPTETHNFDVFNVVYDWYTIQDGQAVSSGHLADEYPFNYKAVW